MFFSNAPQRICVWNGAILTTANFPQENMLFKKRDNFDVAKN
jgi:hypothetical protein